jgi:6-phosphogluconolactonase
LGFAMEIYPAGRWADEAAERITSSLPRSGSVVLTGGSAARDLYPKLASSGAPWAGIELFFGDERCVPPSDPDSNYALARRTLLRHIEAAAVHRMRGEDEPGTAAGAYEELVAPRVEAGWHLLLLGMGAEGHVAGLFPNSPALAESRLCVPVARPDGLTGLSLTPPALTAARRVLLLVSGTAKADAVRRAVSGVEAPETCPVRMFAHHPDATFVLDEDSASLL